MNRQRCSPPWSHLLFVFGLWLGLGSCTRQQLVDSLVHSAYRPLIGPVEPARSDSNAPRYQLLAGDMHCHVSPPDDPSDVSRDLDETLILARKELLDFVVLTPHVGARFFMDEAGRRYVVESQAALRARIAELPKGNLVFVPGFEYTDYRYGHVSASFADVGEVLDEVSVESAQRSPGRFFEQWVAKGGLLVVNHPFVTPIDSIIPMARADLSWRPFTSKADVPPEIAAVDRLAQGLEVFNLAASELRDRFLLDDAEHTIRASFEALDGRGRTWPHRMSPVGGSDSHGHHLRATTFVLAEARTEAAIRAAIVAGRVCVRDPSACSFEARIPGGAFQPPGASLERASKIEVRAHGGPIEIHANGKVVARPDSDEVVTIALEEGCSVVRARVGKGYSGPVFVGCVALAN